MPTVRSRPLLLMLGHSGMIAVKIGHLLGNDLCTEKEFEPGLTMLLLEHQHLTGALLSSPDRVFWLHQTLMECNLATWLAL